MKAIVANGAFCVNILRDDQSHLSDCFAGRWRTADGDRFSCGDWFSDVTGSPRAVDSLVAFSCRLASWQQIGTHCVFFGSVEDVALSNRGSPLIYVNKAYGTALRLEPRSQDPAAPV